ncbi:hypothetical protein EJ06DRAFT_534894 [Trichodelitschia bisporula]|uniref:Uncharacterized protein n=1 Tax=Trichodelitschia bisporula TaxID=703511 RepID=A0A6G1HI66_9PEZI|nr:hypothetical protein EJ06DRAFT_534894 [Trichodelitschia bisporula]
MLVSLLIVKLTPVKPCEFNIFRDALKKLTIVAYELTVENNSGGVEIGKAHGLAELEVALAASQEGSLATPIFQDFRRLVPLDILHVYSVGTAVVVVKNRSPLNVRLEYRIDDVVVGSSVDYNVSVSQMELDSHQTTYMQQTPFNYFALPLAKPEPSAITLSNEGTAPPFDKLLAAINSALTQDDSSDENLKKSLETRSVPLTAAQCRQLASVIVWNRSLYPAPAPSGDVHQMYTLPLTDTNNNPLGHPDDTNVENSRRQFEGDLQNYHRIPDSDASRLTNYVFAVSAAIQCESMSAAARAAGLVFPVEGAVATGFPHAFVVLEYPDGSDGPRFTVPAAFFYALGASLPLDIAADERYRAAKLSTEDQLQNAIQKSVGAGTVAATTAPVKETGSAINVGQAARRLAALGAASAANGTQVDVTLIHAADEKSNLLGDWLLYNGLTSMIDSDFWGSAIVQHPATYLTLLLQAVTQGETALVAAIRAKLSVSFVKDLVALTPDKWQAFFADNAVLLPTFTLPGSTSQRTDTFIQRLRKFFTVPETPSTDTSEPPDTGLGATTFGLPLDDTLAQFINEYQRLFHKDFDFWSLADAKELEKTVRGVYPDDAAARTWLSEAVLTVTHLVRMTNMGIDERLKFSLMEALYARGLTRPEQATRLTFEQFQQILIGTIAYPRASLLWNHFNTLTDVKTESRPVVDGFSPVNDGSLVVDVPAANFSPLGPIAYLHDLLAIPAGGTTLGEIVADRRGPLHDLQASMANLEAKLPAIDLVNESLEALGSNLKSAHGAVFDTVNYQLPAVAEHSSPAQPSSTAYDALRSCFTSVDLPYSQALDVCRSNLAVLGADRFQVMRHFRADITELPVDGQLEPKDFARHLWRYPVRLETALEYLHIAPEEHAFLFGEATDADFVKSLGVDSKARYTLSDFLKLSGLTFEEFRDLHQCDFVPVHLFVSDIPALGGASAGGDTDPQPQDPVDQAPGYRKLFVFVRLWRCLARSPTSELRWRVLADVCRSLRLFSDTAVNPDFPRQLAALFLLRDLFKFPFYHPQPHRGAMLTLWTTPAKQSAEWDQVEDLLLERVEVYAKTRYACRPRQPSFCKDLKDNLAQLSLLAGFVGSDWFAKPTSTIRFVEVLAKIYASEFTVGEVVFLFSNAHLVGDDPFPMPDALESALAPLRVPDFGHNALGLRKRLLGAQTDKTWNWRDIRSALLGLGLSNLTLDYFGEHFFPETLERCGLRVKRQARRFEAPLAAADTSAAVWNTDEQGPFHYDTGTGKLWMELPLRNEAVLEKLKLTRQLSDKERMAVQQLYFAPRAEVALLALVFENFPAAVSTLLSEPDENERFRFFQRQFALFYRRCEIIAEHLAEHVSSATDSPASEKAAWEVLRSLVADESHPGAPWETDEGAAPADYLWGAGSGFAALLGLVGTGLVAEYQVDGEAVWREATGDLTFFGDELNQANAPVPTVIPALGYGTKTDEEVVNGFAIRDSDGKALSGAQGFRVRWSGSLLVDETGDYVFHAGHPRPDTECPDFGGAKHNRWIMTVSRGQKKWTILNHAWQGISAPAASSEPITLRSGMYHVEINFEQRRPNGRERAVGFQVKYTGPDTRNVLSAVPANRLFQEWRAFTFEQDLKVDPNDSTFTFLRRYCSSVRDIRRTYQRAFKGTLLVSRHSLSAAVVHEAAKSELRYLLSQPTVFAGASYYRPSGAGFVTHRAYFDLNLLPVFDPYPGPEDPRSAPSGQRQAALFDTWERLHDYTRLRKWVRKVRSREFWLLFYEASQQTKAEKLLRFLGVPANMAPLVLNYFAADASLTVGSAELADERWATRVWRAGVWLEALQKTFRARKLLDARPWMWAARDLNVDLISGNLQSGHWNNTGNWNLTNFVKESLFDTGLDGDIRALNNGLRLRARKALLAYLYGRVPLGEKFARTPQDLSDLLLQDVDVSLDEMTTRIDDAIAAVQTFVQRMRLGLETNVLGLVETWDERYATFRAWQSHKRREVYPENWIQWDELRAARKSEAFRFLQGELRCGVLSVAKPSHAFPWAINVLDRQRALLDTNVPDGPRALQDTALYEVSSANPIVSTVGSSGMAVLAQGHAGQPTLVAPQTELPLWIQSALDLGTNFLRIAAATPPPALTRPKRSHCKHCDEIHPPSIDEFYFWLTEVRRFDDADAAQNLELGARAPDPACDWDPQRTNPDGKKLQDLLRWESQSMYALSWCRVHRSKFDIPRQSDSGVVGTLLTQNLDLIGRELDSLVFSVNGVAAINYDLADDTATVFNPQLAKIDPPKTDPSESEKSRGLMAAPYFMYYEPGAPLMPSTFSTALNVASVLNEQGRLDAALKWFELAFETPKGPLERHNAWAGNSTKDKAVLLEYLETLTKRADSLILKGERREARIILNLISQVLGGDPWRGRDPRGVDEPIVSKVGSFAPARLPSNPRLLALWASVAAGLDAIHADEAPLYAPHRQPYRFTFLLSKAAELADSARALGQALLAALEKGDSEYLTGLQSTRDKQLAALSLESRKSDFRQVDWDVQGLQQSIKHALGELNWNQTLIRNGNNAGETAFVSQTELSQTERIAAQASMSAGEGVSGVPDFYVGGAGAFGSPLEFQKIGGGSSLVQLFNFAASILNSQADAATTSANLQLTQSTWDRRFNEWLHQVDAVTIELKMLECQKLAADRHRDTALREVNNVQRQIEHAVEVQDFLRDKTTTFDLYLFLQREAAAAYRQTFELALKAARDAQDAFRYELRGSTRDFLSVATWDSLRDGLVAGDRLALALHEMDRAYTTGNVREHELTKQLSLNLHFPLAFLQLKATGRCQFEVPEWMFDLDYPGHYMRRIKDVALTVPCVVGPYSGIHARLELVNSTIRTSAEVDPAFTEVRMDTRFVHLYGTRESIATSTGTSDTGLFEVNFRDERYLPFEYAGAVSRWRLEMPPENNSFDPAELVDAVLSLNYTARDDGPVLRRAASEAVRNQLPGGGLRLVDVKREWANVWAGISRGRLPLAFMRNMFPFLTGRRVLRVTGLKVFVAAEGAPGAHFRAKFCPDGRGGEDEGDGDGVEESYNGVKDGEDGLWYNEKGGTRRDLSDGDKRSGKVDGWRDEWGALRTHGSYSFDLVARSDWPGLYHGVLGKIEVAVRSEAVRGKMDGPALVFEGLPEHVSDVFLVVEWAVVES